MLRSVVCACPSSIAYDIYYEFAKRMICDQIQFVVANVSYVANVRKAEGKELRLELREKG